MVSLLIAGTVLVVALIGSFLIFKDLFGALSYLLLCKEEKCAEKAAEVSKALPVPFTPSEFVAQAKAAGHDSLGALVPDSHINVWVVPHKDAVTKHKWAVKLEKATENLGTFKTQSEAEKFGREKAKELKVELFISGRNGEIRKKNSYGHDPSNVKG